MKLSNLHSLISQNLTNELPLPRPNISSTQFSISEKQECGHLHHSHVLEKFHAAVILVSVHPRKHHRPGHGPGQLDHGRVHLHARPAVLQPNVENHQLPVIRVLAYQVLHLLPAVQLDDGRMVVAIVQHVAHQLVWADAFLLVHLQ